MGTADLPYRFERNQQGNNLFYLNFDIRTQYLNNEATDFKLAALYLDKTMDELGIDRYVFIGGHFPGTQIYGWTRHSPMGPYFFLPPEWIGINALDSLVSNIRKADVVVVGTWEVLGTEADYIGIILNEQFTMQQINRFPMYFRKK